MTHSDDFEVSGRDMREGMGIGGWHMRWTVTHKRTGLSVTYDTHGHSPQHRLILNDVKMMLEMLANEHYPAE